MPWSLCLHCSFEKPIQKEHAECRAHSRFVPSQWEMALLCNNISCWLGASLESALECIISTTGNILVLEHIYTSFDDMWSIRNECWKYSVQETAQILILLKLVIMQSICLIWHTIGSPFRARYGMYLQIQHLNSVLFLTQTALHNYFMLPSSL